MEYAYATCLLSETGTEINEANLQAVLEAAGSSVQESRIKAVVAAVEEDAVVPETVRDPGTEQGETETSQQSEPT